MKEKRPDLVIPDLMMPRMHGFTVCQAVRGDPSLRHIANLATSAKSYPVDVARAHEFGADYYPTKPYDIQVLLQYAARQGWGHRTWKDALESAQEADVTQLDLFHHDPGHDDATMDGTVSSAREYMDQRGMHFNCFAAADNMLVRI